MTIRHPFGREDWRLMNLHRGDEDGRPKWMHHGVWLTGPDFEAHAEWNVLARRGFGLGFQLGRNGSESDLGLNVYLGRLASIWLRVRAPWTKWARVEQGAENWYYARHSGIRFFPHEGRIVTVEVDNLDGYWSRDQPWWREFGLSTRDIVGRNKVTDVELASGGCRVPLPEGNYDATFVTLRRTRHHVRYPGKILDWFRKETWVSTEIDIPGGIPVEGKGENAWDCGMDGTFSITAPGHVEEVVGKLVTSIQRDRNRYGGPHNLPRPMSVQEASDV